jgi:hypothetical protein
VPGPNEASAVDGSREDELAGGAASSCGHVRAWRVCLSAVHGGSRARVQRVAGGRWRMADGRWPMADGRCSHGGRRMLRRGERGEHLAGAGMQRR